MVIDTMTGRRLITDWFPNDPTNLKISAMLPGELPDLDGVH